MHVLTLRSLLLVSPLFLALTSMGQPAPAIQWQGIYGGSMLERTSGISTTADGGYVFVGEAWSTDGDLTNNEGIDDVWVVKLDAQGGLEWQRALGGSTTDKGWSVVQLQNEDYVVTGFSGSADGDVSGAHGGGDAWVFRLSAAGSLEWQRALGGPFEDQLTSIVETADGKLLLAGRAAADGGDISGSHGGGDAWLVKLTPAGTLVWQRTIGGSGNDYFQGLHALADGGFIAVGSSNSTDGDAEGNPGGALDGWIVRTSTEGDVVWQTAIGGAASDHLTDVAVGSSGDFVVAGDRDEFTTAWLCKVDADGALLWERSMGSDTGNEIFWSVVRTADDNFIAVGTAGAEGGDVYGFHGGSGDGWVVKVDPAGDLLWSRTLGGSGFDEAYTVDATVDGGCVVGLMASSVDGDVVGNAPSNFNAWIVKLDPDGNTGLPAEAEFVFDVACSMGSSIVRYSTGSGYTAQLSVRDTAGRLLRSAVVQGPSGHFDLGVLPSGMYLLELRSDIGSICERVVVP